MKNYAPTLLIGLLIFAMYTSSDACYNTSKPAAPAPEPPHICRDSTHRDCDGMCICDGYECPQVTNK